LAGCGSGRLEGIGEEDTSDHNTLLFLFLLPLLRARRAAAGGIVVGYASSASSPKTVKTERHKKKRFLSFFSARGNCAYLSISRFHAICDSGSIDQSVDRSIN